MFRHKILLTILIAAALRKVMSGNVLVHGLQTHRGMYYLLENFASIFMFSRHQWCTVQLRFRTSRISTLNTNLSQQKEM